ncbi:MAG TPA: gamma-glutamyl-gamma-aminobutyrate hydrolase family protein [Actinomycetes bacterium]|nr:gamma-glutamyl-gamma-aminobutyrate hydrolase family protein [Actinomycetes bacterium]
MSPRRPVIGISAYQERARWGVWDMGAVLVPERYVTQVAAAGGLPIVLPPAAGLDPQTLELLDGLILSGGPDLDPASYGQLPHAETAGLRPERDAAERSLLDRAITTDVPTLGICRGMQLLAVSHGGRLEQHLPDAVGHERHRPALGVFGEHGVRLAAESLAGRVLGPSALVRSYHHQGVADAGSLTVTGWADDDTIEVVEVPGKRFAIGVLWHPEAGDDSRLFDALVHAADG